MTRADAVDITPSARRLTGSLRDVGYDFVSALADLVDNSLSAGARHVDIVINFDGPYSTVTVADDGSGMTQGQLGEALRFGSRRQAGYKEAELGRYGLGLKTASLSQARRLTVVTRHAPQKCRISALTLDLDEVLSTDRWDVHEPWDSDCVEYALDWLEYSTGTVVFWEDLDRLLPKGDLNGTWPRRKFQQLAQRASEYLGMVFHRFLDGQVASDNKLTITVNGDEVRSWNPFAPTEPNRTVLPEQVFEVASHDAAGTVRVQGHVLPNRDKFSTREAFERMAGPRKWNRQQGIYVYRADRLIQGGGWCGLRAADEHTKLARASLDFATELDPAFRVNIAKMRVTLPSELRRMLERPINELCREADAVYRRSSETGSQGQNGAERSSEHGTGLPGRAALILRTAALEAGEMASLEQIMAVVRERDSAVAEALGW